jgi:alpha-L-fucosidase
LKAGLVTFCLPAFARAASADDNGSDRTVWYQQAKFGMFIHWGPYAQASVEASWPIMVPKAGGITEADYRALPKTFNPTKFDPHAWVDLARQAGQKYMVFTTKHHDGFCMFDSAYTDYKITRTPYGKDIVSELAQACHEDNMPLGFYYSPPDMHHPGFRDTSKPASENWHGEPARPEWHSYLAYMQLQLRELLTRYGPAALIWFDGLNNQEKYDGAHVLRMIAEMQSATLVNDRLGVDGDYETPEQFIPTAIPTKGVRLTGVDPSVSKKLSTAVPRPEDFRLWETCMTINNTWAFNKNDHDYKAARSLIRGLVEVASRGGNFCSMSVRSPMARSNRSFRSDSKPSARGSRSMVTPFMEQPTARCRMPPGCVPPQRPNLSTCICSTGLRRSAPLPASTRVSFRRGSWPTAHRSNFAKTKTGSKSKSHYPRPIPMSV